ncbi:TonB-dependent receptor [bacterium]|nr:TonB-dependent receptor [bacterium]
MVCLASPARRLRAGDFSLQNLLPGNSLAIILILFTVFGMWITPLHSQSDIKVQGQVVDVETGQAIPYVQITITGTNLGTVTDTNGKFFFRKILLGKYSLTAKHIGYKSQTLTFQVYRDQPTDCVLSLKPSILVTQGVSIQAQAVISHGHKTYLSHKAIQQTSSQDIGELLTRLPDVAVQRTGGPGSPQRVSIRGSQSSQVLILLDGAPLNDPATGETDLSIIPLSIVENIEVIKGGASHQYGAGALGGVIRITTRQRSHNEYVLETGFGSLGLYRLKPHFTIHSSAFSFIAAAQFQGVKGNSSYTYIQPGYDNVQDGIKKAKRINADNSQWHIFSRISWSAKNHKLSLSGQAGDSHRGLPGKIHVLTPWARTNTHQQRINLNHKFIKSEKFNSNLSFTWSATETENVNICEESTDPAYTKIVDYHHKSSAGLLQLLATTSYNPTSFWSIIYQLSIRRQHYKDRNLIGYSYFPIGSAKDQSWGSGISSTLKFNSPCTPGRFQIETAMRFDAFHIQAHSQHRNDRQWSPGVAFQWKTGSKHSLAIQYRWNRSFRIPTLNDLFYQEARVQGRPDLLPEKAQLHEMTASMSFKWLMDIECNFIAYRQKIQNMIHWRIGFHQIFSPINTDAKISGEEYSIQISAPSKTCFWKVSYTNIRPINKDPHHALTDKYLIYRPLWTIKSSLTYHFGPTRSELLYRHIGPRYYTESNTSQFNDYKVIDFSMSWKVASRYFNMEFATQCFNLCATKYELMERMPLPGREFRFSITLTK